MLVFKKIDKLVHLARRIETLCERPEQGKVNVKVNFYPTLYPVLTGIREYLLRTKSATLSLHPPLSEVKAQSASSSPPHPSNAPHNQP